MSESPTPPEPPPPGLIRYRSPDAILWLLPLLGFVGGVGLLCLDLFWQLGYKTARLYLWWPVGAALASALLLVGLRRLHRWQRRPLCAPPLAYATLACIFLLGPALVAAWATDRGVGWFACMLPFWLLGAFFGAAQAGSVGELWRQWPWLHRDIFSRVRRALQPSARPQFRAWLEALRRDGQPFDGAFYCLHAARATYEECLEHAQQSLGVDLAVPPQVHECLEASSTLLGLIELLHQERSHQVIEGWDYWQTYRAELEHESWLLRCVCELERDSEYLDRFAVEFQCPYYVAFLRVMERRRLGGSAADLVEVILAQRVVEEECVVAGRPRRLREEACDLWLVASRQAGSDAYDAWLAMLPGDDLQAELARRAPAASTFRPLARRVLTTHYERWRDQLVDKVTTSRQAVETAFAPRFVALRPAPIPWDLQNHAGDRWRQAERTSSLQSSFPHVFVTRSPWVWVAGVAIACSATWPAWYAASRLAPLVSAAKPAHNAIDHIGDPRPGRDYTSRTTRLFAATEQCIALASDESLTIVDLPSRVPYQIAFEKSAVPPVAVSALGTDDDFLVVGADQSVQRFSGSLLSDTSAWASTPQQLTWPGDQPLQVEDIVANRVDDHGLLLAVRDRGVGRYLWSRGQRGELLRARSWQLGALSQKPLRDARVTRDGMWFVTDNQVGHLDNETLSLSREHEVDARYTRIDGDRDGSWLVALNDTGRMLPFAGRWQQSYFGLGASTIRSEGEVELAVKSGQKAWLATSHGLYCYDPDRRRLQRVGALHAQQLQASTDSIALVAALGPGGLLLAGPAECGVEARSWREGPASSLGVAPDAGLVTYLRREGSELVPVAVVTPTSRDARPVPLRSGTGWPLSGPVAALEVRSAYDWGSRALFITNAGAFEYDAARGTYIDATPNGVDGSSRDISFSTQAQDGSVLAVAGGMPFQRRVGSTSWNSLTEEAWPVVSLEDLGDDIFGVDQRGQLRRRLRGTNSWFSIGAGASASLVNAFGSEFLGDVSELKGDASFKLLHQGKLVSYDATKDVLSESALDLRVPTRQLRLDQKGDPYFLGTDGVVRRLSGGAVFGGGAAPFSPRAATAVQQARDGMLWVGGPQGQLAKYQWATGTWEPAMVLPERDPVTRIVELDDRLLAGTTHSAFAYKDGWVRTGRRFSQDGKRLALLRDDGIVLSEGGSAQARVMSRSSGMRRFVEGAGQVWQPSAESVVFFQAGSMGIYDSRADDFRIEHVAAEPLGLFRPWGRSLLAVAGSTIIRFGPDLSQQRASFNPGSIPMQLTVEDDELQLLLVENDQLVLKRWSADLTPLPSDVIVDLPRDVRDAVQVVGGQAWVLLGYDVFLVEGTELLPSRRLDPATDGWPSALGVQQEPSLGNAPIAVELGGERLRFERDEQGLLGAWFEHHGSAWGSCGGLATQCIQDLALLGDQLMLASEAGVLVWDLRSDAKRWLQATSGAVLFLETSAPRRIVLQDREHNYLWNGQSFEPTSGPAWSVGSASIGEWRWTITAPTWRSSIVQTEGGPEREVAASANGFRFVDDSVKWLYRSDSKLVAETAGGFVELLAGRSPVQLKAAELADCLQVVQPTFSIDSVKGHLRLSPADGAGRPTFVAGRLFHNQSADIVGSKAGLHVLVPGRGVLLRGAQDPFRILRFWPTPPGLADPHLDRFGEQVVLSWAGGPGRLACALDADRSQLCGQVGPAPTRVQSVGRISWRQVGRRWEPFAPGLAAPLHSWWGGSKFTWDRTLAIEALDQQRALLLTDAGLLVGNVSESGFQVEHFRADVRHRSAQKARLQGRPTGALISGGPGPAQLVTLRGGELNVEAARPNTGKLESPRLTIALEASPLNGSPQIEQEWLSGEGAPALRSRLSPPFLKLFGAGGLMSDGAAAAAPVAGPKGEAWWTSPPCEPSKHPCLLVQNEVVGGRLLLRDVETAPCPMMSLRGDEQGSLIALCNDGSTRFRRDQRGQWQRLPFEQDSASDVFWGGDCTTLDVRQGSVRRLTSCEPSAPHFRVEPARYPLFVPYQSGSAFSVDVLTGVSFDETSQALTLGTMGGLYRGVTEPAQWLAWSGPDAPPSSDETLSRLEVEKKVSMPANAANSPPNIPVASSYSIGLPPGGGLALAERRWSTSLDAWTFDQRPIQSVLAHVFDSRERVLWLATEQQGLFKVFVDGLVAPAPTPPPAPSSGQASK